MKIPRLSQEQDSPGRDVFSDSIQGHSSIPSVEAVEKIPPEALFGSQNGLEQPPGHFPPIVRHRGEARWGAMSPVPKWNPDPYAQALTEWLAEEDLDREQQQVRNRFAQALAESATTGKLDVLNEPLLVSLPKKLKVLGDMTINNCPQWVESPKDWVVHGRLTVQGCHRLPHLSGRLDVKGDVFIADCPQLKTIVVSRIGGDGEIRECPLLQAILGTSLHVAGDCDVNHCPALKTMPESIQIGGMFGLYGCLRFPGFTGEIDVGGTLEISQCHAFGQLGRRCRIGGDLWVKDSEQLLSWPAHCQINGIIDVRGCSRLATLSLAVLKPPEKERSDHRICYVSGSGITDEQCWAWQSWRHFHQEEQICRVVADKQSPRHFSIQTMDQLKQHFAQRNMDQDPLGPTHFGQHGNVALTHLHRREQQICLDFFNRLLDAQVYFHPQERLRLHRCCDEIILSLQDVHQASHLLPMMEEAITGEDTEELWLYQLHQMTLYLRSQHAERLYNKEDALKRIGQKMWIWERLQHWIFTRGRLLGLSSSISGEALYLYCAHRIARNLNISRPVFCQQSLEDEHFDELHEILTLADEETQLIAFCEDQQGLSNFLSQWQPWQKHLRYRQLRRFRWSTLPQVPFLAYYAERTCPLSLRQYAEIKQPITLVGIASSLVLEWGQFCRWWLISPYDPYNRQQAVDLSMVRRLPPLAADPL